MSNNYTIQGTTVTFHGNDKSDSPLVTDYGPLVDLVADLMEQQYRENKPKCAIIEGDAGSGKTVFANVLIENGRKVIMIDGLEARNETGKAYSDPYDFVGDMKGSYIIDDPHYFDPSMLKEMLEEIIENDGLFLMLVRDHRHSVLDIRLPVISMKVE